MTKRVCTAVAVVLAATTATAVSAGATPGGDPVRQAVHRIVDERHAPAALMTVRRNGADRSYWAGRTPPRGHVRVGSITKTFVSAVVLQLVAEGRIELDAPVDRYLPGLLRGEGVDGRVITVRQLLQHTSGLPEYTEKIGLDRIDEVRRRFLRPHEILDVVLAQPAQFPPGSKWAYTNTNYIVAGLLVQQVTGRPVAEQIAERVINRLGLRDTYWPAEGEPGLRGPHPRGFHRADEADRESPVIDITTIDPSWAWAAGQLVSTNADVATFYRRLLAGDLLAPAQLAQMRTTVETGRPGLRYGLGLVSTDLTCGGVYWGHSGGIHGYATLAGATDDGRSAAMAQTALPGMFTDPPTAAARMDDAQDRAFCSNR